MKDQAAQPFPLDEKLGEILARPQAPDGWTPTGLTRDIYTDLSEPIVRMAAAWQDENGRLPDPYQPDTVLPGRPSFTAARFVGALGFLIGVGRCLDLVGACARSMEITCRDLYHAHETPVIGAEFYPKELMRGYLALRESFDPGAVLRWKNRLGGYDPEKNYTQVLSKKNPGDLHNFVTFALAGEACKKKYGVADNTGFIERHVETQRQWFTPFGMYRDPNDPMTYDYTSRMNLSLMLYWGYDGSHRAFLDEMLRRGAITSLFFLSPSGEAPFGGRSNQFQFNEATLALTYEYEANRYKALGDLRLAGTFKRAARLATQATRRWLDMSPPRFVKNQFPPELQHGREARSGLYGVYSLLIASIFGFAHLLADDTIEENPAPCETGGFVLHLPGAFHKVFATGRGYHVEIDTNADHHYDATGLGRVHRAPAPGETALSAPLVPAPRYLVSAAPAPRSVALGPGWEGDGENARWLADASDTIDRARVSVKTTDPRAGVEFEVTYAYALPGCESVTEHYRIRDDGVTIGTRLRGSAKTMLVQVPLLETDGLDRAELKILRRGFVLAYRRYRYRVECLYPRAVEVFLEPFTAPNRNGIYRVGCFRARGNRLVYRLSITGARRRNPAAAGRG